MNQKLSFPSLIFGLIESPKPLQEPNELLLAFVQPYIFRFKEKDIVTEREQDFVVTTEKPSVAIESQPGATSSSSILVQSFFRAELRAIKDK